MGIHKGSCAPFRKFSNAVALRYGQVDTVANARINRTTHRVPWEMLTEERPRLGELPDRVARAPYLREDRKVGRDGFVSWDGSRYGVRWK